MGARIADTKDIQELESVVKKGHDLDVPPAVLLSGTSKLIDLQEVVLNTELSELRGARDELDRKDAATGESIGSLETQISQGRDDGALDKEESAEIELRLREARTQAQELMREKNINLQSENTKLMQEVEKLRTYVKLAERASRENIKVAESLKIAESELEKTKKQAQEFAQKRASKLQAENLKLTRELERIRAHIHMADWPALEERPLGDNETKAVAARKLQEVIDNLEAAVALPKKMGSRASDAEMIAGALKEAIAAADEFCDRRVFVSAVDRAEQLMAKQNRLFDQRREDEWMEANCPPNAVLRVLGAGTKQANGYYVLDGEKNGKPIYSKCDLIGVVAKERGRKTRFVFSAIVNSWTIKSSDGTYLYSADSAVVDGDCPLPPLSDYKVSQGEGPAPSVRHMAGS